MNNELNLIKRHVIINAGFNYNVAIDFYTSVKIFSFSSADKQDIVQES